ncbi:nuclear transport factor 2 family protein [Nonomuraea ferruginea]|uniref:Nuclear transport factor 2 family protein n=1 Tax=Nonomuraea ferruginea TaxID=46174 RepID=A0ABT4T1M7_9ACTN|nr:nuclear transport factor 2 family protein [Nonomuraea ferruginea]MDA0643418.1 nuclear transport factor 2 family protein [Nonomuraea ferruginea]
MVDQRTDPVEAAVTGELRLLDPTVRSSANLMAELLHPEFKEVGASGRLWSRSEIIASLAGSTRESDEPIRVSDMTGLLLAPGVVHLTYVSDNGGRRARRSSVWRWTDAGWRLYFHQGTLSSD